MPVDVALGLQQLSVDGVLGGDIITYLTCGNPHNLHGIVNHVSGALLTFVTFRH